jgi:hypothetical protein
MKRKWFISLITMVIGVAACGQAEEKQGGVEIVDELTPIEVKLEVPQTAEVGEMVTFSSSITQGEDLVRDASEVAYEIWFKGEKEQSQLIEAQEQDGHVYLLDYTFDEAGLYQVQTHVTARGLHRMPITDIQVGEVKSNDQEEMDHSHKQVHYHEHEHPREIEIDTSIEGNKHLVVQVAIDGLAYNGGAVTLEMWQIGDEERQWFDLEETEEGQFELRNVEELSGPYSAIVHIQDGELHEHVECELEF